MRGANKEEAEKLARELLAKSAWQNALTTTLPSFLVVNTACGDRTRAGGEAENDAV